MLASTALGEGDRSYVCPLCKNHFVVDMPVVSLETNYLLIDGMAIHVAGQVAEVMSILVDRFPSMVTTEQMMMRLYGARPEQPETDGILGVLVHRLRKAIAGSRLKVINEYATGFRLEIAPRIPLTLG